MRIAVLVLGILAAGWSAVGGFIGKGASDVSEATLKALLTQFNVTEEQVAQTLDPKRLSEHNMNREIVWRGQLTYRLWLTGAGVGLLASFFAFARCRFGSALMFLSAAAGPVLFNPLAIIFSGALILPGILALFIGPYRPAPARRDRDDDDDRDRDDRDD